MASTVQTPPEHRAAPQRPPFRATLLLALLRLRRTWGMLLATGVGMVTAVLLVCAIPLYSQITMTAGLHTLLASNSQNATLTVHATLEGLSSRTLGQLDQTFSSLLHKNLGNAIDNGHTFSLRMPAGLPLVSPAPLNPIDTLALQGYDMSLTATHAKLLRGHLPASAYTAATMSMEVALTQATAQSLKVDVGSTMTVQFAGYSGTIDDTTRQETIQPLALHVVGIYSADSVSDAFWGGYDANPLIVDDTTQPVQVRYSALVSNGSLLQMMDQMAQTVNSGKPTANGVLFSSQASELYWYYHLDSRTISTNQLNQVLTALNSVQQDIKTNYGTQQILPAYPYIELATLSGPAIGGLQGVGLLVLYSNRVDLTYIPVTILMALAVGLILFFIAMMANLLVDRQLMTIAILRSRGASRGQVFGSFLMQSVGLALIALVVGSLLALPTVYLLTQRTFGAGGQSALDMTFTSLLTPLKLVWYYALVAVLVCIMTMMFCVYRAVSFDVLTIRRESARATGRAFWQRLNLDIVAIVIALTGFAASIYLSRVQALDASISALVIAPLSLVAPIFLALAVILILLRIYPSLLNLTAWLAARGRGVSAMLAVGQMARSPRQAMRMTLLLALASAFAIFSLVFSASQSQHASDIASYQVGADFSGVLPPTTIKMTTLGEITAIKALPGVLSVAPAYSGRLAVQGQDLTTTFPLQMLAVDTSTFAKTVIWPQGFSSQSLSSMMQQLVAARTQSVKDRVIPAIVDALTWQRLGLTQGQRFQIMASDTVSVGCIALAEVDHIPTVDDGVDTSGGTLPGGMVVDFQTFAKVSGQAISSVAASAGTGSTGTGSTTGTATQPDATVLDYNFAWVSVVNNDAQVARISASLSDLHVTSLLDRRQLATNLRNDPLYLSLAGELVLAAAAALLLALAGSLLGSWLSTKMRVTNFALLRALGTSLQQVAGVLTWEQAITYLTAILLGTILGGLLSITIVPSLVASSVPYNTLQVSALGGASYALEHILPVQIVIPLSLMLIFGTLIIICVVVLAMMVRVVTQPALGRELRLNED